MTARPLTPRRALVATVAASIVATLAGQETRQTFRSGIDAVMVDVSVRADGKNVTGLRVDDFVLTDNGVRQRIESVEATAVPLDVTLVVDLSGNPRRPWIERRPDPKRIASALEEEVGEVARILRPIDRIRLLTVDRYVKQVFPLQAAEMRGAMAVAPRAHAARVALMNVLSLAGSRAEAESLSEQIQSDSGNTLPDPWWMYWQGHYRFHPQAMARLREMSQ